MDTFTLMQAVGSMALFSSRAFVTAFVSALLLRFGPDLPLLSGTELLTGIQGAPTWFTHDTTLLVLGVLAALEILARIRQRLLGARGPARLEGAGGFGDLEPPARGGVDPRRDLLPRCPGRTVSSLHPLRAADHVEMDGPNLHLHLDWHPVDSIRRRIGRARHGNGELWRLPVGFPITAGQHVSCPALADRLV